MVQLSAPEQLLSAAMMRFNVARRKSPRQEKAGNTQASSLSLSLFLPVASLTTLTHSPSALSTPTHPGCFVSRLSVLYFLWMSRFFHTFVSIKSRPPPVTTNPHQFEPSDLLPLMGSERNTAVLLSR